MSEYPTGSTNPFGTPPSESVEYLRVGFGPRLLAYIIDVLLAGLFAVILAMFFMQFELGMSQFMSEQLDLITGIYDALGVPDTMSAFVKDFVPAMTLGAIIANIMYALIEGLTGASPGKRIMKIVIAHQDATAGNTALWLRRFAVKYISAILSVFMLVPDLSYVDTIGSFLGFVIFFGYFLVLGQDRLTLHDRIAQTAVYYREDVR